jgi:hypothetical protein
MASSTINLTTYGVTTIYQNGVEKAFKNFSITDAGYKYDINVPPNLDQFGGTRTLVTVAANCEMSTAKAISQRKPTNTELSQQSKKLEWQLGREYCEGTSYSGSNAYINVNLKTWFNYLTNTIGNYDYEQKLKLSLIDSIKANLKELNPATYSYDTKNTIDDLSINYVFESVESANNYINLNPYFMSIKDGVKTLNNNTDKRFWSPITFLADTEQNGIGRGNNWKLGFTPVTWGYVTKLNNDNSTTFNMSDFISITDLESMSESELNETYRAIYPACKTDKSNRTSSLFVLKDTNNTYNRSIDGLSTLTERFFNSDDLSLMAKLIQISENYILMNFTENPTTPGLYEQIINFKISNNIINGETYNNQSTDGGNIQVKLQWDSSETDNVYDNAVTWGQQ